MLIGYARVSTEGQDLDSQTRALLDVGVHPASIFAEKASGRAPALPILSSVIERLKAGDVLCVVDLDRLSRLGIASIHAILARVSSRGARVRSLRQSWCDPSSPLYDLLVTVSAWFASREVEQIRARTNEGITAARARGVRFGRPASLTPTQIDLARDLVGGGRPLSEVAGVLGVHRSTLARAMRKNQK